MKAPVQELWDAAKSYSALLDVFRTFHAKVQERTADGTLQGTSVDAIPDGQNWFDLRFADMRLRVALSLRRWQDARGVVTCYRLPPFGERPLEVIAETEFIPGSGETPLHDYQGDPVYMSTATAPRDIIAPWIVQALHTKRPTQ